jgi:hypothetical protein
MGIYSTHDIKFISCDEERIFTAYLYRQIMMSKVIQHKAELNRIE